MAGMRLRNPSGYIPRWQQGPPAFGTSLAAKRRAAARVAAMEHELEEPHDDDDDDGSVSMELLERSHHDDASGTSGREERWQPIPLSHFASEPGGTSVADPTTVRVGSRRRQKHGNGAAPPTDVVLGLQEEGKVAPWLPDTS